MIFMNLSLTLDLLALRGGCLYSDCCQQSSLSALGILSGTVATLILALRLRNTSHPHLDGHHE